MPELSCDHEEADAWIFLHAQHAASNDYKAAIIAADDTDVLVIALGLAHVIGCQMYQWWCTSVHGREMGEGLPIVMGFTWAHPLQKSTHLLDVTLWVHSRKRTKWNLWNYYRNYQLSKLLLVTFANPLITQTSSCENRNHSSVYLISPRTENIQIYESRYMMFFRKKYGANSSQLPSCQESACN